MTPKEKATELVNKMPCQIFTPSAGWVDDNEAAKECALIAVYEVINNYPVGAAYVDVNYWQQVREEIKKL
jgi:hypothetical protein